MNRHLILQIIYYGSFLAFPYLAWLGAGLWKKKQLISIGSIIFLLGISFIWARFIEPQWLINKETTIYDTKINTDIVLLADIHLGVFKSEAYLSRVVEQVNSTQADFNVIAGDFIYKTQPEELPRLFAPLKKLNRPTYIVFGNHDQETPQIKQLLVNLNLINIEHEIIDLGAFQLAGVGDRWDMNDKPQFTHILQKKPLIIVAHNPDSVVEFDSQQTNIVLSGHTHCGQIRIPYLYKKVIPSSQGRDCDLEFVQTPRGTIPVFITGGIGEIGLPMRLFNRPRIDLLHLRR